MIFEYLYQIKNNPEFNIKFPVKIAYGYFSRKIPYKTIINGKVVDNNRLILHNWHVWNYIYDFIVDVSIFNKGTFINYEEKEPAGWNRAEDHVFVDL